MAKSVTTISGMVIRPDFEFTNGGTPVLKFSMADEVYAGKDAKGNYLKETQWIRVSIFGERGEKLWLNDTIFQGTIVQVTGQLVMRTWESKGKHGASLEMMPTDIVLVSNFGKKNKEKAGEPVVSDSDVLQSLQEGNF